MGQEGRAYDTTEVRTSPGRLTIVLTRGPGDPARRKYKTGSRRTAENLWNLNADKGGNMVQGGPRRSSKQQEATKTNLVDPHGRIPSPPELGDRGELVDGLVVHAHGVVNGELVSRHALVDVARPFHAGNVGDAGERSAVSSEGRSTMKGDRASTAALEVILGINTFVSIASEPRAPVDTTSGITAITLGLPLPLIGITFMRTLAGAVVEVSALSVALRVRMLANAFTSGGSVTVTTIEVTWILRGAFRSCVIGVDTVLSTVLDLIGDEIIDLRVTENRSRVRKSRVGLDD